MSDWKMNFDSFFVDEHGIKRCHAECPYLVTCPATPMTFGVPCEMWVREVMNPPCETCGGSGVTEFEGDAMDCHCDGGRA